MPSIPFKGEGWISSYTKREALPFIDIFPSLFWSWWCDAVLKFVGLILRQLAIIVTTHSFLQRGISPVLLSLCVRLSRPITRRYSFVIEPENSRFRTQ